MAVSHIDALCHVFVDGQMYNGFPATDVTSRGAQRNSIEAAFGGIVGRGVLLDIPRLRGVEWLEPGDAISPDELDAACAAQQVAVEPGDILLVATGRDARRAAARPVGSRTESGLAGLDPECIPWLHEHDPAVLGSDGVSDLLPAERARVADARCTSACSSAWACTCSTTCSSAGSPPRARREQRWEFLFVVLAAADRRRYRLAGEPGRGPVIRRVR